MSQEKASNKLTCNNFHRTKFRGSAELLPIVQHTVSQHALCLRVTHRLLPPSNPGHGVENAQFGSVRCQKTNTLRSYRSADGQFMFSYSTSQRQCSGRYGCFSQYLGWVGGTLLSWTAAQPAACWSPQHSERVKDRKSVSLSKVPSGILIILPSPSSGSLRPALCPRLPSVSRSAAAGGASGGETRRNIRGGNINRRSITGKYRIMNKIIICGGRGLNVKR